MVYIPMFEVEDVEFDDVDDSGVDEVEPEPPEAVDVRKDTLHLKV